MKHKFQALFACTLALMLGFAYLATAQNYDVDLSADPFADPVEADDLNEDRPDAPWITHWWALDGPITDNGGFAVSAPIDWLDEGTGGTLTQESVSTWDGLQDTRTTTVDLPDNGGNLGWGVFEIDPADGNNMSTMYGLAPQDNFDTYAIIIIGSPDDRTAVMGAAHDDHAQIWVNGEKVYNNSRWTGAATQVDYDIEVGLNNGVNVLLYRCGESGGSDYFNLHFSDADQDLAILPNAAGTFFDGVQGGTAVQPKGKLPVIWGDLKGR